VGDPAHDPLASRRSYARRVSGDLHPLDNQPDLLFDDATATATLTRSA
jgi:hypothetical protein